MLVSITIQCKVFLSALFSVFDLCFIINLNITTECTGAAVKCENIKVVAHLSNMKTSTPNMKKQQRFVRLFKTFKF